MLHDPSSPPLRGSRQPKAWLVVNRPNILPTALAAADALADHCPGGCHLLREDSSWWRHARWEPYRPRFAAVHTFARIKACRGPFDVVRAYRQFAARQRALAALPIDPARDTLICLAGVTELANAAVAAHRDARRLLCVPQPVYENLRRRPNRWRYRFTTAGWLQNHLIEPLAGLERSLHFKPRLNRGGDGVRLIRLRKTPEEIYDAVIILSNTGREHPPEPSRRTYRARFPGPDELGVAAGDETADAGPARRAVVFFGTPFLLVRNLPPAIYTERLNDCLDYLRRFYPDRRWVYRPHPAETGEAAALRLAGFEVETDGEAAELYFLRRPRAVEAVYSVSSTVSRVALNAGLNAYCFWRCFPFAARQQQFFEKLMGVVPPGFDRRDLSTPPLPYAEQGKTSNAAEADGSFAGTLRTALDGMASRFALDAELSFVPLPSLGSTVDRAMR